MEIGDPKPMIVIEPIEDPVPHRDDDPDEQPIAPAEAPDEQPVPA